MEDDDEFGDLYTDVLRPFSSSLSAAPPPHTSPPAPPPPRPLIDLNLVDDRGDAREDATRIPHGAPDQNSAGGARVLSPPDSGLPNIAKHNEDLHDKDIKFDIEEGDAETGEGSGAMPGMIPELMDADPRRSEADVSGGPGRGRDDWDEEEDSDSEDDLQIVLNDNSAHGGTMMIGVGGDEDNDEDEDPLVIVTDGDPNQGMEEQEWGVGEDAGAASALGAVGPEGERKEGGEGAPVGAAAGRGNPALGQKMGYSSHGYHHPFHSQFKYVRPGAAPIPGAGPAGAPGQLRPPITMGPMAGRGRGDWRPSGIKGVPPMQKSFHPGFGMPWGNNTAGRGLEFTLPSHKAIFDVDIDGFEEKPWKYPGADMTDFFNFGLNEETWKDYCKQLEQHRLETTMQSKIRVYESGRAEKEYDPEMPPELAAATGAHDGPADNANSAKLGAGQTDFTKGPNRARPPVPAGRAIQVETGYGERLPSIDTRAPRIRDSDAIIEIVLQDSLDDPSTNVVDGVDDIPLRDELRGGHGAQDDMSHRETEYLDDLPHSQNSRKGGRRTPFMNSTRNHIPEEDVIVPFRSETPTQHLPGSKDQPSSCSGGDNGIPRKERLTQGGTHDNSPHSTSSRGRQGKRSNDDVEEDSVESMDGKRSPLLSPSATARDVREISNDDRMPDELLHAEGSSGMERDEMTRNEVAATDTLANGNEHKVSKREKITSLAEQPALQELDDFEESKAARSSENSKARSGSSKDYQKWQDGVDDEVVQDGRSTRTDSVKSNFDENEQDSRRKDRDVRHEMDRNRTVIRGKEGAYPHRDVDPGLSQQFHKKSEGYERRKEPENLNGPWQRRDEDPHSRKGRSDDKKRERGDETATRHRSKTREDERTDKDEHLHPKKQLDNGNYRIHHDKDGSSRYREREDGVKSRYEVADDYHNKRRKDEEFMRRDQTNKEKILFSHREITGSRRRERDDVLDPRKRDDQQRIRENLDDYHSARHKDDIWLQRERGERQREEFYRVKQSHDEKISKREREDSRGPVRGGRVDDKAWVGHTRVKDEYMVPEKLKDVARSSEHLKRRDRMDDRGRDDVYVRGNQFNNDERRPRQERSSTRIERSVDVPDNQRAHERKHKESTRKSKDSEGGDYNTSGTSRRNQDGHVGRTDEMGLQRTSEPGNGVKTAAPAQRNSSKRRKEDASSDEEQPDSKKGRSKLERWTSHTERDFSISKKTSATIKLKEIDRDNNVGSSEASKLPDEAPKKAEAVETHPSGEEKDAGDTENNNKDTDGKPLDDWHLDTVEKLKKRSERFKLPLLTSDKDTVVTKTTESEPPPPPPVKTEALPDSEIKAERPPRKRRWISS